LCAGPKNAYELSAKLYNIRTKANILLSAFAITVKAVGGGSVKVNFYENSTHS
ncbi:MAG: hypothetical protein UW30_C0008G0001, partial [Candidatus Giovannonibacteria bacterium GW2011_GWA2_44_13b]